MMNKVVKKLTGGLLLTSFLVSTVAGCGSSASSDKSAAADNSSAASTETAASTESGASSAIDMKEDPYTVAIQVVTLPGTQFEGETEREEAINAITVPAINCKVDIQEVWISEVANKTSMAVAGGEKMDLIHVATVNPLSSLVGSDILYDMNTDNLLANRGKQLVTLFGDKMKAGEVKGQQLAVPARTFDASAKGFYYNKDMADKAGVTIPESGTVDDIEKALYAIKKAEPDVMPFFVGEGTNNLLYWMQGYEGFGTNASYGAVLDSSKETKVENLYASDAFKNYVLRMYKWKKDGIIPGDPTDTNNAQSYMSSGKQFAATVDINPTNNVQIESQATFKVGFMQTVAPKVTNSSITEYMWGIASNSERPDKAMDFLNYMYSNAEVANILNYGIKGTNYDFASGSDKIITSNNSYIPMFFRGGDTSQMLIQAPAGDDFVTKSEEMEKAATVSPLANYMFDDTDYKTEAATITATITEYLPRLQNGMADSEDATLALLDEFNQKLKASGIDDVIAANQKQLDEWKAAQ